MTSTTTTPPHETAPDATWTVNDVLQRFPETIVAFNAFGVDACCGGASTLYAAAADAEVPLDDLLTGLRSMIGAGR